MPVRYAAARVEAKVTVQAFEDRNDVDARFERAPARRQVELQFTEVFADDAGLDLALEAFAAAIREAARR